MNARMTLKAWVGVLALASGPIAPAIADPVGLWRGEGGGTIRIQPCGPNLCAVIASQRPPLDPATGQPWTDKNNPDASKRRRPLIGVEVLSGMQPTAARKWTGRLYDPDRGMTLSGNLLELDQDTIRIEGCLLLLCGGKELRRAK